jgi:probable HAF family extracellular repeat protein
MRGSCIAATIAAMSAFGSANAQSITMLQTFFDGGFASQAYGISGDGSTTVGQASWGGYSAAAIWHNSATPTKPAGIAAGGGFSSSAYGVNHDGSVVVGETGYGGSFRWTASGGTQTLGSMSGGWWSSANGVSGDGSVVVGWGNTKDQYNNEFTRAFRWTETGGMQSLGALHPYGESHAKGVNADGSVIVGDSGDQAFRWTNTSGMSGLGFLSGASSSAASAVSGDGSVIVGKSGLSAFRWTASSGIQALAGNGEGSFFANALNFDGSIIVGNGGSTYTRAALVWENSGSATTLLDYLGQKGVSLAGWSRLIDAVGISSDGRYIAGWGIYEGQNRAFVADIGVIPAPSAATLLALAGLTARGRRRR